MCGPVCAVRMAAEGRGRRKGAEAVLRPPAVPPLPLRRRDDSPLPFPTLFAPPLPSTPIDVCPRSSFHPSIHNHSANFAAAAAARGGIARPAPSLSLFFPSSIGARVPLFPLVYRSSVCNGHTTNRTVMTTNFLEFCGSWWTFNRALEPPMHACCLKRFRSRHANSNFEFMSQ